MTKKSDEVKSNNDKHRVNPLLAKVQMPGRIFKLPSGGFLYKNGEVSDIHNGEIHVRPLSALAEIKMKSPDLLFSGKALEEVFAECVPDVLKPLELFGKDIDAIMIFLRIATYGPIYTVEANHRCENGKMHKYDINLEDLLTEQIKELDPTTVGDQYTVEMPNGQKVTMQPIRMQHMIDLMQTQETSVGKIPTVDDIQRNLITNLLGVIHDIDGHEDQDDIKEWIGSVATTYISRIAEAMEKANDWGASLEREVTCPDCTEKFLIDIPINPISFFTE